MNVREMIAELEKVEDKVSDIVVIANGDEWEEVTVEDHSEEDPPFVSIEGY